LRIEKHLVCDSVEAASEMFDLLPFQRGRDGGRRHHFHEACIRAWLATNTQCPTCRASLARA